MTSKDEALGKGLVARRELKLEIGRGPVCPHCKMDTFDDWWHDPSMRAGSYPVSAYCRIKCHGCGKFFKVTQYTDGAHHSEAHTALRTDAPQGASITSEQHIRASQDLQEDGK